MSRSTKKSQKPSVPLSKVPSVKELCEQLGFQRASIKDTDTFMDATRAWRRSYKTSKNLPGGDLLRWNDPAVQSELKEMAATFLETGDNSERFWGFSRNWYHPSDIQFPEESERIVDLLMQLFWKQNKYAFNNSQYGHKQSDSAEVTRATSTPVRETWSHFGARNDVASNASNPIQKDTSATSSPKVSKVSINTDSMIFSFPNRMVSDPAANRKPRDRDIFEGPDDVDQPIRGSEKDVVYDSDDGWAVHDSALNTVRASIKRRREEGTRPHSRHEDTTSPPSPNKKKKYHLADSPRRTDRKRIQRNIPGTIRDDEVERRLKEQEKAEILESERADMAERHPDAPEGPSRKRSALDGTESVPKTPVTHASPQGKAFSAPTAPMTTTKKGKSPLSLPRTSRTVLQTGSPSKVGGKNPSNTAGNQSGPTSTDSANKSSDFRSRKPQSDSIWTGAGRSEVVIISPTDGEDVPVSKSPLFQKPESNKDGSPFPASTITTTEVPSLATSSTDAYKAPTTEEVNEDDDVNLQRTILDSIAQVQPQETTETKAPADFLERQDTEHHARRVSHFPEPSEVRYHTGTSIPLPSTEKVDVKSLNILTPQPAPQIQAQPQIPTQPMTSFQPTPTPTPTPTDPSSSKPRPKTQIPLWIITREPRYTEERWDDGKLSGTPLTAFIAGISQVTQRQHIEKIKLTLRTPMSDTKITVSKDAEDSWTSAKETFVEKLKEARLEARARRQNESLNCKILVEPFYEQSILPSGSVDEDGEEFDI